MAFFKSKLGIALLVIVAVAAIEWKTKWFSAQYNKMMNKAV